MDNTLNMDDSSYQLRALFVHTPAARYQQCFRSVTVAGRCKVGPEFRARASGRPGHDLLLCVSGFATVQISNRTFSVSTGEMAWINQESPRVVWPRRTGVWEFVWVHFDSPQSDSIAAALDVDRKPIFKPQATSGVVSLYRTIFRLMRTRPVSIDAELDAAMSSLIAVLFKSRQAELSGQQLTPPKIAGKPNFAQLLDVLRSQYGRQWTIRDIARLAGLSVAQLFRLFAQATGTTPMDWLRRERINRAKRQLIETRDRIGDIAEHVGYGDQLYFSRDFKKVVGVSPRAFRQREQVAR